MVCTSTFYVEQMFVGSFCKMFAFRICFQKGIILFIYCAMLRILAEAFDFMSGFEFI